jgi:hypothetical protein
MLTPFSKLILPLLQSAGWRKIAIAPIGRIDAVTGRVPRLRSNNRQGVSIRLKLCQFEFPRLAGGTMPFMRRYSTIWP